ncbi:dynamin family protein [Rhodovulum viride]|nr:dynamin family protein [Rhodovulum viride]
MSDPYDLDIRAMLERAQAMDAAPARPRPGESGASRPALAPEEAVRAQFGGRDRSDALETTPDADTSSDRPAADPDNAVETGADQIPHGSSEPPQTDTSAPPAEATPPEADPEFAPAPEPDKDALAAGADPARPADPVEVEVRPHLPAFAAHPNPADLPPGARPCLALMGEFSAGKSTLIHLLIGQSPLPVKVTATQLPPVRLSYGSAPAWREDRFGRTEPVEMDDLHRLSSAETRLIQIHAEAEILKLCDLIDMPGISDPNMGSEVWENAIGLADGVIWCSHATQAWRQSEAAVWDMFADRLGETSLLLLTRFDKLVTERDRARVLRRVRRETEGLFADICPIALTDALDARDNPARWAASGADGFGHALRQVLRLLGATANDRDAPVLLDPDWRVGGAGMPVRPRRVQIDESRTRSPRPLRAQRPGAAPPPA